MRELGVYCEIHPWDVERCLRCARFAPRGVILSGGPESVTEHEPAAGARRRCSTSGVPVLGICYGMQTMAQQLGGRVERARASGSSAMPR